MVNEAEKELVSALRQIMEMYDIQLDEDMLIQDESGTELVDYSEVISKTQAKIDELTQKTEEIYKKTGMTREELLQYSSNPNNFTKTEWESLEQVRQACDAMKQRTVHLLEKPQKELLRNKPVKGEKQTKKFSKRKNWLSG